ncbi:MAG: hypothetical protein ABIP48_06895, partial [Planctomycetota bacterium]
MRDVAMGDSLRHVCLFPVWITLALAAPASSALGDGDIARDDWHFRESLAAIRDWEAILARWEEATPEAERTPVLPVPASGEAVEWPNPIPRMLLPAEDRNRPVRVHLVDGKMEVTRVGPEGQPAREAVSPGETVLGYKHPGGGGKDQWYHRYDRRFDRLTTFTPKPARFALRIDTPLDLHRGGNRLAVALANKTGGPLKLTAELQFHLAEKTRACGQQAIELPAGATESVVFPVELNAEGGGLLALSIRDADADESFWTALFTHVEDVTSVFESVEQILAD